MNKETEIICRAFSSRLTPLIAKAAREMVNKRLFSNISFERARDKFYDQVALYTEEQAAIFAADMAAAGNPIDSETLEAMKQNIISSSVTLADKVLINAARELIGMG